MKHTYMKESFKNKKNCREYIISFVTNIWDCFLPTSFFSIGRVLDFFLTCYSYSSICIIMVKFLPYSC